MNVRPPRRAQQFFSWYCRNQLHDSIIGDLNERFYLQVEKYGEAKAKLHYWLSIIRFINRFTLKRDRHLKHYTSNPWPMFRNTIVGSLRFLARNKRFALINSVGLTLALTSFLVILFFVRHELSFDNFHKNKDNIYRVNFAFGDNAGGQTILVNTPPAFSPGIQGRFPELLKSSRMRYATNCLFANGDVRIYEDHGYFADSLFLEIFTFDLISGDARTALDEPNSVVITSALASKLFDNPNPIGETLTLNTSIPLKVTGVISSVPTNSHLNFEFLISFPTYVVPAGYASDLTSWEWLGFMTYVELQDGANPMQFESKLVKMFRDMTPQDETPMKPIVQKLSDIYLSSNAMTDDLGSHMRSGSQISIYSLLVVAILILVIAGFNFSNLTHAISLNRGKSMAMRKVLGANRETVVAQFFTENIVLTIICMVIAYSIFIGVFPWIAAVQGWGFAPNLDSIISSIPILAVVALMLGLMASFYPAFLLSRIPVIKSLKGELKIGNRSPFHFRNVLVLTQFSISIALIAATIVLSGQTRFLRNQSLGFDKENVVVIKMLPEEMTRYYLAYKTNLMQSSSVMSVSRSDRVVGEPWPFSVITRTDAAPEDGRIVFFNLADYDFMETLGIDLVDGRSFSMENRRDSLNAVVINQSAASLLGYDDPIGKEVHFFELDGPRTIVGVVRDFNYTSLHDGIEPAVMILPFIDLEYMYVRLAPGNIQERIAFLEDTWRQVSSGTPLEWRFLDEKLNVNYQSEARLSDLFTTFAALAVALACLGLYGIVALMINNRMKEFGVRKILGASVYSLYIMFVKPYLYQMLLAMVIVVPLLHYYLTMWLQEFAYRISIGWWIYPLSTLLLVIVALTTVTLQTMKVMRSNPVTVLRSE